MMLDRCRLVVLVESNCKLINFALIFGLAEVGKAKFKVLDAFASLPLDAGKLLRETNQIHRNIRSSQAWMSNLIENNLFLGQLSLPTMSITTKTRRMQFLTNRLEIYMPG
jgi:hypothetical protein